MSFFSRKLSINLLRLTRPWVWLIWIPSLLYRFLIFSFTQDGDRVHIDDAIGEEDDNDNDDKRSPNGRAAADDEAVQKRLLLQNRYRQIKSLYERGSRCPETILGNGGKELGLVREG